MKNSKGQNSLGKSPLKELEESPRSGLHLLVLDTRFFVLVSIVCDALGTPSQFLSGMKWRALVKDKSPQLAKLKNCTFSTSFLQKNIFPKKSDFFERKMFFLDFWNFLDRLDFLVFLIFSDFEKVTIMLQPKETENQKWSKIG